MAGATYADKLSLRTKRADSARPLLQSGNDDADRVYVERNTVRLWTDEGPGERRAPLRVGLVNNMPDGAYLAAEAQFGDVLRAAAPDRQVELNLFALPGIARSAAVESRMQRRYLPADEIESGGLDALIVTGAEVRTADLRDEGFWPPFTRLVDWVEQAGLPTLWSCLAAHACVLHLDGIERRRLPDKCTGLFDCTVAPAHPLLMDAPSPDGIPHSRYNTLDEAELNHRGYAVLTRSDKVGVDSFVRRRTAPFLFCQGHLEYGGEALTLEYKRDLTRYLRGEQEDTPALPQAYFTPATEARLLDLRRRAMLGEDVDLVAEWPRPLHLRDPAASWRGFAAALYQAWLNGSL